MATYTSIHSVTKFSASTVQSAECSPHLTLDFEGDNFENRGGVTFFLGDAVLTARLIEAINSTVAARKAELSAAEQGGVAA